MFVALKDVPSEQFSKTTLIMPALSIGRVGELALQLLIKNNPFKKIGYYQSNFLQSFLQLEEQQHESPLVNTGAELYQFNSYTILQIITSVKNGRKKQFLEEFQNFLQKYQFKEIILLSSLAQSTKPDQQIDSQRPDIYFLKSKNETKLNLAKFQSCEIFAIQSKETNLMELLDGIGLTRVFLKKNGKFKDFGFVSLLTFASDGNDTVHACYLLQALLESLSDQNLKSFEFTIEDGSSIKSKNYVIPKNFTE